MNKLSGISLYNQDRLSDESFVDNFVARLDVVELLLNGLLHQVQGGETQHHILIGSRGMGKTSLLRRLAIGITTDRVLRDNFIPLRFREEQYNVISLSAFWRNCGESLAEWCEANKRHTDADQLDRAMDTTEWRDPERAAFGFLQVCNKIGRRPVLLLDNLDLILGGLEEQECWSLRGVLQKKIGPLVIGAATDFLAQGGERSAPFFEFFHPHVLEPLTETEILRCMRVLADRHSNTGASVRTVLSKEPERIRTLYALTGGNPRILVLIYQLLERAESDTIFANLEALLDQVTPFYKARIEEYQTSQQRAVIDAIALNWDPISSSAISRITGIDVTTISSHLSRLKKVGFIEEVSTSGARSGYQLGERFLNIWYLMRHGTRKTKQRLRWLTIFLTKIFSATELGKMAAEARGDSRRCDWHPHFREAVIEAYSSIERIVSMAPQSRQYEPSMNIRDQKFESMEVEGVAPITAESQVPTVEDEKDSNTVKALVNKGITLGKDGRNDDAIAVFDEVVSRFGAASEPDLQEGVARALMNKGITLGKLGRNDDAIAVYDEVVSRFGAASEPNLLKRVAAALVNKGVRLGKLDRNNDAIAVYDEVVSRFGAASEPDLLERVARALLYKGVRLGELDRNDDAIAVYDEIVSRFGAASKPDLLKEVTSALVNKGATLGKLDRNDDAIAVYDEVVSRFGAASEPDLLERVTAALVNKGITLGELGRNDDAIAVFDEVVSRFGAASEPNLLERVARALLYKGVRLGELDRNDDAIAVYDEVVSRFGAASEPDLQERVAAALVYKGVRLGELDRNDDAIAVYDEVVSRFGAASEPDLLERVAAALVYKGAALGELDRNDDAIAVYDEVVSRFGAASEPDLQERVAAALVYKGVRLGELDRNDDAIAVYDEVVSRFGAASEPDLLERVAAALVNKGITLGKLDRNDDAIAVYDEVVSRFGAASEPDLQERVARALVYKGATLGELDRNDDAIAVYDEVVSRFGAASEPDLQEGVARALVYKGATLGKLDRNDDAIAVFDEVVSRFGAASEPDLQERVAAALVYKGAALGELDRNDDAIAVYDEVVSRFGAASEPDLQKRVARALVYKGVTLGELDRNDDAIAVYDEVVSRFGAASEPDLLERVAAALVYKGAALGELDRNDDAIAVYDEVVSRFGAASEPDLQERVARALLYKGVRLGELDRNDDAIAVYDEVVSRFGAASEPDLLERVTTALMNKGRILFDQLGRIDEAEITYRQGLELDKTHEELKVNLVWTLLAKNQFKEAKELCKDLETIKVEGRSLLNAGIEIAQDNIGLALDHLHEALETGLTPEKSANFEDLFWLLRLAEARGFGEQFIAWFETSNYAERYAPIFGAYVAYVRGENFLLDFNPEVRGTARKLFESMLKPHRQRKEAKPALKRRSRGRPRK